MPHSDFEYFIPGSLGSCLTTMIIYPGSNLYSSLRPQFDISGHAFLMHEHKSIIVDGSIVQEDWFTKEHLYVIMAHELAHYRAEHAVSDKNIPSKYLDIEQEADWLGCMILKHLGYEDAYNLHKLEYVSRYNSTIECDHRRLFEKLGKFIF